MIKAGLVGIGGIGRAHLKNYIEFNKKGDLIQLVAVCDIDPERFVKAGADFNLDEGKGDVDFGGLHKYTDMDEMIKNEQLDMVTLALPTYLHCEATVKFLEAGVNVLCEKPMARTLEECDTMLDAARRTGKRLMIGHCLRFWDEYSILKNYIDSSELGKPVAGFYYRGGGTPAWSYQNWLLRKELGGGAVFDQHIHDVDTVLYMHGMPKAVSSAALNIIDGSGYDTVSTNYIYPDGKVINTQNDWTMSGGGFMMGFRVNFTGGTVVMDKGFTVAKKGEKKETPEFTKTNAYAGETAFFARCIRDNLPNEINPPEASKETIRLVLAEIESAGRGGEVVYL